MAQRCVPILLVTLIILAAGHASATSTEIGPTDDLRAAVNALLPGDELVLHGGLYTLTFRFSIGVSGTAAAPIVIRAFTGEVPHLTRDPNQNTINVENAQHLVLRGLEVSGGSHGIRLNASSFITIEDCHVHDTGDVAISANIPGSVYEGLTFRNNHIHDTGGTGEGFYLGCNNAGCTMFDSVIEGNWIHDTINGTSQGDGIEIKLGSYGNTVRNNLIHDTRYPCILVYGTVGNPVNVVERNTMWGCGDHGIQAAADAVIRNNVILDAAADGIHCQLHQGAAPGNLTIAHNTVLNIGDALRLSDVTGPITIANNALYSSSNALRAAGNLAMLTVTGNLGTGSTIGIAGGFSPTGDFLRDFVDATTGDVHLAVGSALIAAGDPAQVVADDRDGDPRNGVADIGAYRFATTCLVPSLTVSSALLVARTGPTSITFTWTGDASAVEQHLNSVENKSDLAGTSALRAPLGVGLDICTTSTPGCTIVRPPDDRLFYQAVAACGPDGTDEGPVE